MKTHSQDFKNEICLLGKQQEILITYMENQTEKTLTGEDINSAVPHYEADLLKSVMKELDLDSNTDIPINTEINFKYGLLVNGEYEYIDFGNYIVFSSEKQEDTYSYNIKCYDKIIFSMKPYKTMNVQYPITIKNYINSICNYLGLGFANINDTFTNYDKQIPAELYLDTEGNDLGYTFRDVLDELAQVTGSVICLNNSDQIEIRYPNSTNDIINEEYLKDVNVKFGETYGPINTVVLSRSAGADKISLSTPENLPDNQKIAVEIRDNQIMNFNNRDEFLPGLLGRLYGTEYYLNDFTSTGIVYYDLLDKYSVQVGENIYNCLMLNNEINITQGLEEQIYTKKPETAETDYTKTDKTDRRINQTYLIVDKQNQKIESVILNVTQQNNKISQITQTVDELNSKIEDIADITTSAESIYATISLDNINQSEPIELKVRPAGENISYLYPHPNLFPSSNLYLKTRTIRFIRTYEEGGETLTQNIDYILPDDLLYYDNDTYDEFYLNYDSQTCQVIKRCKYNADGTVGVLDNEITTDYEYPQILLYDGDYEIKILGYNSGYISARLMAQNIYTTQFATKAELSSSTTQTKGEIDLSVNQKLQSYPTTTEMNSAITIKANEINSVVSQKVGEDELASKISQTADTIFLSSNNFGWQSNNSSMTTNGNLTATGGNIGGFSLSTEELSAELTLPYTYTMDDVNRIRDILAGNVTPTQEDYEKLNFTQSGEFSSLDMMIALNLANGRTSPNATYTLDTKNSKKALTIVDDKGTCVSVGKFSAYFKRLVSDRADFNGDISLKGGISIEDIPGRKAGLGPSIYGSTEGFAFWLDDNNGDVGFDVDTSQEIIQIKKNGNMLDIKGEYLLYANGSGNSGTVNLYNSVSDFKAIRIIYKNSDGQYGSTIVEGISDASYMTGYGTIIRNNYDITSTMINSALFEINDTTITIERNRQTNIYEDGATMGDNNKIYITEVYGIL